VIGEPLLGSWFLAGFEGSTHRRSDGRRLDMVAATGHDRFVDHDYQRMKRIGIYGARESLRWHLVEHAPGSYDFRSEVGRLRASVRHGITVAWDLCHFGWPDHVDPFGQDFTDRFAAWARAVAVVVGNETPPPHWFVPQNEISFLAWAGGEVGVMNPHSRSRGPELKRHLVAGAIRAMDAIRSVLPDARFLHPEPLINVATDPERPHQRHQAAQATEAQFEAWDMLAGRLAPELGGSEAHLDVLGANYYPDNQWMEGGGSIPHDSAHRAPLSSLLTQLHRRYRRRILISETGTEDEARPRWLREVSSEAAEAVASGVPLGGICLYPVVNHPGWEDERHCRNGVWDYPGPRGGRAAHRPLVRQLLRGAASSVRG
jgi:beta-glucosidase/6-phospho-beta-glucosidase/beta-galactosidase